MDINRDKWQCGYAILNKQLESLRRRLSRLEEREKRCETEPAATSRPFSFVAVPPRDCWFCKSSAVVAGNTPGPGNHWVYCSNEECDHCGPTRGNHHSAVGTWNMIQEALSGTESSSSTDLVTAGGVGKFTNADLRPLKIQQAEMEVAILSAQLREVEERLRCLRQNAVLAGTGASRSGWKWTP